MQREGKSIRDIATQLQIPPSTLSDFLRNDNDNDNDDAEYDDKEKYGTESDDISKNTNETNYDINYKSNGDADCDGNGDGNYNGMVSGQFSDTCTSYENIGQYCDMPGGDNSHGLPW